MTAAEAYADAIAMARSAADRQRKTAATTHDLTLRALHESAATTLDSFAAMLEKVKEIRCG